MEYYNIPNQKLAKTGTKTIQTYYLGGFSPITIKRIIENDLWTDWHCRWCSTPYVMLRI